MASTVKGLRHLGVSVIVTLGAIVPVVRAQGTAGHGIDVTGFVDGYYSHNFNDPAGRVNDLRSFDVDDNSLDLSLVALSLEKKPTSASRGGFRADLGFGPTAEILSSLEPGKAESLKNLQQAYASWLASPKLQLDFGKFVTQHGAEVVASKDNWNYTRSLQFGWAIPFYHAGLRGTYAASDTLTLMAYLVNGWNNVVDNNDDKTVGFQAVVKPRSNLTWLVNYTGGKEQTAGDDFRNMFDTVVTLNATSKLSLMANYDYGKEGSARWQAFSLYARFQASDRVAFSPRFEWLDDKDAFMTGSSQTLTGITLTGEAKLAGGVLTRLDLRRDFSDKAFFIGNDALEKGQTTVTVGVVYAFGGKI